MNNKEKKYIDPVVFGLPSHTKIYKRSAVHLVIEKDRKSRIIMKDGLQLVAMAEKIWHADPRLKISLYTTAPICSKTRAFLAEKKIDVVPADV